MPVKTRTDPFTRLTSSLSPRDLPPACALRARPPLHRPRSLSIVWCDLNQFTVNALHELYRTFRRLGPTVCVRAQTMCARAQTVCVRGQTVCVRRHRPCARRHSRVSARTTSSSTRIPELGAPVFCESADKCDRGGALAFYPVQTNFALPRGKSGIASPITSSGKNGYERFYSE